MLRKLLLFVSVLVLAVCASAQELKVAAAADLDMAMKRIATAFQEQTGIQLKVAYGSSGHFFAEIRNGAAPFDVFLSADRSYPETLQSLGKTDQGPTIYALGKLALWVSNRVTANPSPDLNMLTSTSVSKIAIADPEHAPYGRAAVAAMDHYKVYDQVRPKLVMGENVSKAAQFAESGNADVALIPWSLARSETMNSRGHFVLVRQDSYPPLFQAAVVLHSAQHKKQAHRFVEFLRSSTAQKILTESGFEGSGK